MSVISGHGSEEFERWWEGHQHNCHANFGSSLGAMDACVYGMWSFLVMEIVKLTMR
jgi:hypothetical protein